MAAIIFRSQSPPVPVALTQCASNEASSLLAAITLTQEEMRTVERTTRGQHLNIQWYKQYMGVIDGSSYGKVVSFYNKN